MIEIAKNVTNLANETAAVDAFKLILTNLSISYFHDTPLPENETKGEAFTKCTDEESAMKYCPTRWKAMMKWFSFAQMVMSSLSFISAKTRILIIVQKHNLLKLCLKCFLI